ncbi:hypothetical protein DL991_34130 [Amycolatopsis sp. WAC 01375]|uniref:hypothetical protein n=1 Tax=unclassified Amycolatopsis TaxID=2618356 RepID=UPI000F7757F8|nr:MULTISPECIES: hypothetical protein [unclassified Amycolatopsis]RSM71997.1 hypothetical protein DL991_34130 [Amycolatopsis sp. WAC 01375]RSN32090.1 hypothetical protein DL990_19380 [Amycolatopsis sp. WAC 01416]
MISRNPRRRRTLLASAVLAAATLFAGVAPAVQAAPEARSDVFIRDNTSDVGFEPSTGSLYSSPDIRVCFSATILCATDDPIVQGSTAYIHVTLNNPGPYGDGLEKGTLQVYYTKQGTVAQWSSQWNYIGSATNVSVPYGTKRVVIPWKVPIGSHFCLLARWLSPTDLPTEGLSTSTNARNNNNIGWHNVNAVPFKIKVPVLRPIVFGWDGREPTAVGDIVFTQPGRPFTGPGRITIDLGPDLAARWRAAGAKGEGVERVGETELAIVNPQQARISGLTFKSGEQVDAKLSFTAGAEAAGGQYTVHVTQVDQRGEEVGGVEYRLSEARQ